MYVPLTIKCEEIAGLRASLRAMRHPMKSYHRADTGDPYSTAKLGENDKTLAQKLIRAGDEHAKAMRGIIVWFEMEFQVGWMVEWDTYKIGVQVLSTSSTMHLDLRGLKGSELAEVKQANLPKVIYRQTACASYQALRNLYFQRRNHRHPDWQIFCNWIETLPFASDLITIE